MKVVRVLSRDPLPFHPGKALHLRRCVGGASLA